MTAGATFLWESLAAEMARHGALTALASDDRALSYADLIDRAIKRGREIGGSSGGGGRWPVEEASGPIATTIEVLAAWSVGRAPLVIRRTMAEAARAETLDLMLAAPQADAEGLLGRTSGTTGAPKLAALPGAGVNQSMAAIAGAFGWRQGDRLLAATSLSYSLGLTGGVLAALHAGVTIHAMRPGAPAPLILQKLRSAEITLIQGPASLHRILATLARGGAFPAVRVAGQGGEVCTPAAAAAMASLYPNARRVQYFGMTEAGPRVAHIDMDDPEWPLGAMGAPFPFFDWRAVPLADTPLKQLWLKGPTVLLGYLGEAGYVGLDGEGGFLSGDAIDLTPGGLPCYRGRINRCFKSGGQWVNPYTVEAALAGEAGIAGSLCRAEPHDLLGQTPVVDIILDAATDPASIDLTELRARLALALEPFELPTQFRFVADLARTDAGKIALA